MSGFYLSAIGDDENNQQAAEEIPASILASLSDDKLTGFGLRLVLTAHAAIPRESELDFLADAAFVPPPAKKSKPRKEKTPTPKEATKPAGTASPKKPKKRPNNTNH